MDLCIKKKRPFDIENLISSCNNGKNEKDEGTYRCCVKTFCSFNL